VERLRRETGKRKQGLLRAPIGWGAEGGPSYRLNSAAARFWRRPL